MNKSIDQTEIEEIAGELEASLRKGCDRLVLTFHEATALLQAYREQQAEIERLRAAVGEWAKALRDTHTKKDPTGRQWAAMLGADTKLLKALTLSPSTQE